MMTFLKTWCLLWLAVLLHLLSINPTVTEVVQSMSQCGFLLEKPPEVPGILEKGQIKKPQYKIICQTYENKKRFVTLYDTKNRIPVLSAYRYRVEVAGRPDPVWKIEPQLEDMKDSNMQNSDRKTYNHQASDNDYKNSQFYNRGHLFPSSYAIDTSDKKSTFTLTNIVPQAISFNSGSWEKMEKYVLCILNKFCKNNNIIEGYVVTGAQPSTDKTLNNRVNVPSKLWSAFCCNSGGKLNKWISGAFWRNNVQDKSTTTYLPMRTLAELYDELSTGHSRFEAFPGPKGQKCPLQETAESDQRISKACKNPPNN